MTSQIFKKNLPIDMLFDLFNIIGTKNDNHYVITNDSYKKGILTNDIPLFIETCKPYYYNSKQKYLEKKLSYNSFTTIIRQICNLNGKKYTSQINYDKSKYNIVYNVYF